MAFISNHDLAMHLHLQNHALSSKDNLSVRIPHDLPFRIHLRLLRRHLSSPHLLLLAHNLDRTHAFPEDENGFTVATAVHDIFAPINTEGDAAAADGEAEAACEEPSIN